MLFKRMVETLAMGMIGDGLLAVIDPKRHMKLWENGPHVWEIFMRPFVKCPELTRWLGAAELIAGICIAQAQHADDKKCCDD